MTNPTEIDWHGLLQAASEAASHSYSPYSRYPVGAAGLTHDGRIVTGCNVENASYGMTLCAECGMISDMHRSGGGRLVAMVAANPEGEKLAPCGRCRQLLQEAGGGDLMVDTAQGARPLRELLVDAFGPDDLDIRQAEHPEGT